MLNARVQQGFADGSADTVALAGVSQLASGQAPESSDGWLRNPTPS